MLSGGITERRESLKAAFITKKTSSAAVNIRLKSPTIPANIVLFLAPKNGQFLLFGDVKHV
jgi:hypothetical protein